MPAIVTKDFRVHNARQFSESFGESADTYYLGIGRPQAFANDQAFNDGTDTSPPTPQVQMFHLSYQEETGQLAPSMITIDTITEKLIVRVIL